MRRAIALLSILTGASLIAFAALASLASDCPAIEREAALSQGALQFCANNIGCHYEWRDLVLVSRQRQAAKACAARRNP